MTRPTQRHIPSLDGVRGLAILLVMGHHFFVLQPQSMIEEAAERLASLGVFGVDLFFVLSGFLITGILLDGKGGEHQFRNFYARRVLRIFPLYYGVLLVSFLALPVAMNYWVPAASSKLARFAGAEEDWPWYVLFLSNYAIAASGGWRHGVLDVTWSLAIEEQFYIIWPVVVVAASPAILRQVCLGLIATALAARVAVWAAGGMWLSAYVLTPCRMDALAIGAIIALATRGEKYEPAAACRWARWAVAALTIVLPLTALGLFHYHQPWVYTGGYTLVGVGCAGVLVLSLHAQEGTLWQRAITNRPLAMLGKYSYALYLFHLPVRAVIRDLAFGEAQFRLWPGHPLVWQGVFHVLATAAVLPLAVTSWYLFEKPILSLKRYFPSEPLAEKFIPMTASPSEVAE